MYLCSGYIKFFHYEYYAKWKYIYLLSIIQDINGINVNIDDCDAGWR